LIVADFGFGHGAAHAVRRLGDSVRTKIDEFHLGL
jgi:hypothetical protein